MVYRGLPRRTKTWRRLEEMMSMATRTDCTRESLTMQPLLKVIDLERLLQVDKRTIHRLRHGRQTQHRSKRVCSNL